jgi:hypothetical protein
MLNPFLEDIYSVDYTRLDLAGNVPDVHESTLAQLCGMVRSKAAPGLKGVPCEHGGTTMLISARAGLGKTHLLHRLAAELEGEAIVVPITFNRDEEISWRTIFAQMLDRLADVDPSTGELGLTYIQEIARRMFSEVTALLIEEGEVPSANPENAIAGLKRNYLRIFDKDSDERVVSDWLTNNFDQLSPVMANVLSERRGMVESAAAYWLELLRDVNEASADSGAELLDAACPPEGNTVSINSISRMRLSNICRVASIRRSVVFVFDHLDCFHGQPDRGLEIAYLLSELRLLAPGQMSIAAMNRDLWESSFGKHLPEALADRLSAQSASMRGISKSDGERVVRARGEVSGVAADALDALVGNLNLVDAGTPRLALRSAASLWNQDAAPVFERELPSEDEIRPIPPKVNLPLKSLFEGTTDEPSKIDTAEIKKQGNIMAMVERLKQRRKDSDVGAVMNGNGASKPVPERAVTIPIALRQRTNRTAVHPIVSRFRRLRDELSGSDVKQESLRAFVRAVGEQSPIVDFSEATIPHKAASLARWEFPDSEVFFCFSPDGDEGTRRDVIQIGAEKVRLAHLDDQQSSKLVVFGRAEAGAFIDGVDYVDFDENHAVTIEAAARLLADPSLSQAETLGVLSSELDFFWKRVTREVAMAI